MIYVEVKIVKVNFGEQEIRVQDDNDIENQDTRHRAKHGFLEGNSQNQSIELNQLIFENKQQHSNPETCLILIRELTSREAPSANCHNQIDSMTKSQQPNNMIDSSTK